MELAPEDNSAAAPAPVVATPSMTIDIKADISNNNTHLLTRVAAKLEQPDIRLAASADGASGMKTVDMKALLEVIKETEVKQELQKAVEESEKMVRDISNLLKSEGFL
jgi:hypothetical protein